MRIDNFKSNLGFLLGLSSCGRNLLTFLTARLSNLTAKNSAANVMMADS